MRVRIVLFAGAMALAGCNANQPSNASTRRAFSGDSTIQDPIRQAQASGFYAGR
jgi:hypothetical protein